MDSQTKGPSDRREGNIPASTDDATKLSADSTAKTVETESKGSDRVDQKQKSCRASKNKSARKQATSKRKKANKSVSLEESSSESGSARDQSSSSSSDSDDGMTDSDPEDESHKKRLSRKRLESKKSKKHSRAHKTKKSSKSHAHQSSSDTSDTDESDAESSHDVEDIDAPTTRELAQQIQLLQFQLQQQQRTNYQGLGSGLAQGLGAGAASLSHGLGQPGSQFYISPPPPPPPDDDSRRIRSRNANDRARLRKLGLGGLDGSMTLDGNKKALQDQLQSKNGKSKRLEFKRVDQVWDNTIHNYKLQDTAEASSDSQYDEYVLQVRRTFDWEGKYKSTFVDIKSKLLRESLQEIIGNIKGVSLVEETPKLDPNMLFLYLQDIVAHVKKLKKMKPTGVDKSERKKNRKRNENKRQHLKVLLRYLKKDYGHVAKSLFPMLENGLITFDLLWALWKPNTIAYTTTYGSQDEPRTFKVEMAERHHSIIKGDFYYVEGKYFEYDGKQFGYGSMSEEIPEFRGARKITSLGCYPLQYHKNVEGLRETLIERGKKFVQLSGVHYKAHQGMAYYKKKKSTIKVNINGRIMIDPAIHRRINPNYPISTVRPKDHDILSDDEGSDAESPCGCGSDSDAAANGSLEEDDDNVKYVKKVYKDEDGNIQILRVPMINPDETTSTEKLDKVSGKIDEDATSDSGQIKGANAKGPVPEFSDEEYLIASPVLLGFAFAEKLWLEFTVSGVKEIQWNNNAYESLVLEPKTKDIVKALVESHKYHAAESIDDVIQGKGKGLVAVLHGPPGTGKTLTAEGISELLKCPLYMVSAGELGTDSRYLESELQKILDICHAWGAILLLDEADVFLEKRNMHDIHRNALVSIFLRQLEYFQGILFLTTNRVETFDDAFQSRIHIALRYDDLDQRAKKTIFKIFIERVRVLEQIDLMPFSEEDYTALSKHDLNGRQIKNTVRTAQALAVNKSEPLSMKHIRQVLDVLTSFERDLKGGTGYQEAMRSYF